jgi:integrase
MASAWVRRVELASGAVRYRVVFRIEGREGKRLYGGSFKTRREADIRQRYIAGELAAERIPNLMLVQPARSLTLREAAERWQASRVDVAEGTRHTYRVNLERVLPTLGHRELDSLTVADVTDLVAELGELKRESLRKTLSTLAQVLDHAGLEPNPVRSPKVKLPRGEKRHVQPPTAEHVEAIVRLLPTRYRLPTLVLDATGMRVGELEQLTWGDVDEPRERWRVSASVSKSGAARWVQVPTVLFEAVTALVAREDRTPERRVFQGFGADRLRTAITRACTAAAVPVFSPHDLRHRRVSLLHLGGMPWARIGELVGHGDIVTTARTYTHVVADEAELDYVELVESSP